LCLILTVLFIVLAAQAFMAAEWPFAALYAALALFFLWMLLNNVRAILKHKGKCGPSGCSFFDLFKRAKKQPDDEQLGQ
jgi:hypothetical protein